MCIMSVDLLGPRLNPWAGDIVTFHQCSKSTRHLLTPFSTRGFAELFGAWNDGVKSHLLSHPGLVVLADEPQSGPGLGKGRATLS